MAGDAGWPGLGTPLEAADPVPEWRRAERSSAESTPKPPGPTPAPATPGPCCRDTFCNSAANWLGSTPGERCPPTETNVHSNIDCIYVENSIHIHACMQTYQQNLVHTSLKLDMVLQDLWVLRVRQHIKVTVWIHTGNLWWNINQCILAVISHRVIFVRWKGVEWSEGKGGRREGVHGCVVTILQLNM